MVRLDSLTLENTQLTLEPNSEKRSAVVSMTHASDKEYIGGIQNNATLHYAAAPLQFGLRLTYNFSRQRFNYNARPVF